MHKFRDLQITPRKRKVDNSLQAEYLVVTWNNYSIRNKKIVSSDYYLSIPTPSSLARLESVLGVSVTEMYLSGVDYYNEKS